MNIFRVLGYEPSINERDLITVTKLTIFTNNGHVHKGYTIEVEVGSVEGALRTLVRDYDHHSLPQTYGWVQALDFVARTTPFPVHE